MPWRPLVHGEDIARAFKAVIEAAPAQVSGEVFNVGQTRENFRVREVADLVARSVADATVTHEGTASPDRRNYRVDCDKIRRQLPTFEPAWTLQQGIEQLYRAYAEAGLQQDDFFSHRYFRIDHIKRRLQAGAPGPAEAVANCARRGWRRRHRHWRWRWQ